MPIDPEINAEITAIKNKLLKMESDLAGLSGKDWSEAKKEIGELKANLAKLLTPPKEERNTQPKEKEDEPESDPLGEFIDSGKV